MLTGRCRSSTILVDESLQLLLLGDNGCVGAFVADALFFKLLQVRSDPARIQGQLSSRQIERLIARRREERSIVRHDQAGGRKCSQEVFEQNLGAQVEEVRRFVEHQQIGFVQQQSGQLDTRLPSSGQLLDGTVEVRSLEFELPGHFAAFPVRLLAVPHEEIERRFSRIEWVMLTQIPDAEVGTPYNFAAVEFFGAEQDTQQG